MLFWTTNLLLGFYTCLIAYYVYHWYRVPHFEAAPVDTLPFMSVVVAARNEAHNIPALVEALARQTIGTSSFEVIIADDYSTDSTAVLLQPFISPRFMVVKPTVPAHASSKKRAIEAGVAAAKGPLVVITDADCIPPPHWLHLVGSFYQQRKASFIAAPVQLLSKNSLLGIFQQLDFMMLQGITAASVQAGTLSMCNGANLAYEKESFIAVNGFEGVDQLASGDDMLLMYKIWKRDPQRVHYLLNKDAIMPTPAQPSWKSFIRQRIRWSSKAGYYQDKRVSAVLYAVYAFNVWGLFLLVMALFYSGYLKYAMVFWAVKTCTELLLLIPVARFYQRLQLLWCFPFLQPLHLLYTVGIGLLSLQKTYLWKGRRTR